MWFIILSTEPGAFRLDERRWGGGGGQEDNSYQYLSQSQWGLSRFPPPV